MASEDRPLRYCDVCGQLDNHPRHVRQIDRSAPDLVVSDAVLASLPPGPPEALRQLMAPRVTVRHPDCCAAEGCDLCARTETENGGRRGQELIDHLATQREA